MADAPPLVLEVRFSDGVAQVSVTGDLDLMTASALADTLTVTLDRQPGRLVLDLRDVHYLDCTAARVIAEAAAGLPRHEIVIWNPVPIVRRLLQLTGLTALIEEHHIAAEPCACGQTASAAFCPQGSPESPHGRQAHAVAGRGTRPALVRVVSPAATRTLLLTRLPVAPPTAGAIARHDEQIARKVQMTRDRMAGLATSIRTTAGQLADTEDRVAATFARLAELHPDDAGRLSALSAAAHEFAARSRRHAVVPR